VIGQCLRDRTSVLVDTVYIAVPVPEVPRWVSSVCRTQGLGILGWSERAGMLAGSLSVVTLQKPGRAL